MTDEQNATRLESTLIVTSKGTINEQDEYIFVLQPNRATVQAPEGEVLVFKDGQFYVALQSVAELRNKLPGRTYYRVTHVGTLEAL